MSITRTVRVPGDRAGLLLACCLALGLVACGGGGAKTSIRTSNTTMGQELMDLNASYEQGLISAGEYRRARKEILHRYDK